MKKEFHGKVIYCPKEKAGEYSRWAANFYNGCSARCEYCYNRHGRGAKILGGDMPVLKKSLIDENTALKIFMKEVDRNLSELQKNGLFFNFVSDPCLPETIDLNFKAINYCHRCCIPVKLLTKQTWWLSEKFIHDIALLPDNVSYGFTLTGHDELEPGAATNLERIETMKKLHDVGFKTWVSIEPIIDLESSAKMIQLSINHCDFYKIGLQSGKKYDKDKVKKFVFDISVSLAFKGIYIYWKESIIKQSGLRREDLPSNCVSMDFNL
jgi:DNA repair photolyase